MNLTIIQNPQLEQQKLLRFYENKIEDKRQLAKDYCFLSEILSQVYENKVVYNQTTGIACLEDKYGQLTACRETTEDLIGLGKILEVGTDKFQENIKSLDKKSLTFLVEIMYIGRNYNNSFHTYH